MGDLDDGRPVSILEEERSDIRRAHLILGHDGGPLGEDVPQDGLLGVSLCRESTRRKSKVSKQLSCNANEE